MPPGFLKEKSGENWRTTNAYRFNLRDAGSGGTHQTPRVAEHRVIVGRANEHPEALTRLATSFVPLALNVAPGEPTVVKLDTKNTDPGLWNELSEFIHRNVNLSDMGVIAEMPWALAESLCRLVIGLSGRGQTTDDGQRLTGYFAIPALEPVCVRRECGGCNGSTHSGHGGHG